MSKNTLKYLRKIFKTTIYELIYIEINIIH